MEGETFGWHWLRNPQTVDMTNPLMDNGLGGLALSVRLEFANVYKCMFEGPNPSWYISMNPKIDENLTFERNVCPHLLPMF